MRPMRFAVVLMLASGCFVTGVDGVASSADDGGGEPIRCVRDDERAAAAGGVLRLPGSRRCTSNQRSTRLQNGEAPGEQPQISQSGSL